MDHNVGGRDAGPGVVRIGPFTLATVEGQLYRDAERVPLGKRAIALLRGLIDSPGHAVTRNELVRRAWPGRFVEDANLNVQIGALRKAMGRDAIVTSYGRGYRLTLDVEAIGVERRRDPGGGRPLRVGDPGAQEAATAFVGRDKELAELLRLLPLSRLLTVVGSGGIGKTRLILRLASMVAADKIVLFVDLATLQDRQQLDDALAMTCERRGPTAASWRETLQKAIAGQDAYLILDNCEHLAEPCARLVEEVTTLCPTIRVVAGSRVRLFVPEETVFELAPLSLPEPSDTGTAAPSEAMELFISRAAAAKVPCSTACLPDVASICLSVDGVPLAIELAAAWLPFLPVHEVAVRLRQDLRLLDSGPAPPSRHHTMEATIRWSYSMLQDDEREVFRGLSVFSGGCTLEAALEVCGAGRDDYRALHCVARLHEYSLLVKRGRRLSMLEPIRQFAAAELARTGEETRLQRRHIRHVLAIADRYRESDRAAHLALLEPELDNLRIAQQRSLEGDDPRSRLELVVALYEYWGDTGRTSEAASFAAAALQATDRNADEDLQGAVHSIIARYAKDLGRLDAALHHGEQALAIARKVDDSRRMINAMDSIAWAQFELGKRTEGMATALRSRDMALSAQLPLQIYMTENTVGELHRLAGNFSEAEVALRRMLSLARDNRDSSSVSIALINLGLLLIARGDFSGLPAVLLESATTSCHGGIRRALPYLCRASAALSVHLGDPGSAARLLGGALGQMRAMRLVPSAEDRSLDEALHVELSRAADDGSVAREISAGSQLSETALWNELVTHLERWQPAPTAGKS